MKRGTQHAYASQNFVSLNPAGFGEEFVSTSSRAGLSLLSSDDKDSDCNGGDLVSMPWLGRSPGEGNGNPLLYSCLGNPMDRSLAVAGYVHGVAESEMSEWLTGYSRAAFTRIRVCAGLGFIILVASGVLLMSFLRLSNCDLLWNEEYWHLSLVGAFSSVKQLKDTVIRVPSGGTRTSPHASVLSCFSHVWLLVAPMDCSLLASLFVGFSRRDY